MTLKRGATFKLEIKLEGDDFKSYPTKMLQRKLKGVIQDIGDGIVYGPVKDSRGKTIGKFDIEVY